MSKKKDFLIYSGISAGIGALTAFGLSFTNLSPLVVGGIIGAATPALFTALCGGCLVFKFFDEGKIKDNNYKSISFFLGCIVAASAAVGAGLVAAASAYGITAGTVLAGAVIGVLSSAIGLFAACAIFTAVEKVTKYIISPVIEQIKGCFSSQERNDNSSSC